MRGPRCRQGRPSIPRGITPAYAGTTRSSCILRLQVGDHPRLCGDHRRTHPLFALFPGSPPLMRGPRDRAVVDGHGPGITPAYAGTTSGVTGYLGSDIGSPPLMRGPLIIFINRVHNHRITPAYAGTTLLPRSSLPSGPDHPRLCGDHQACAARPQRIAGSPPLMRGPPKEEKVFGSNLRITPAYAGTTLFRERGVSPVRDHPRLCGDH